MAISHVLADAVARIREELQNTPDHEFLTEIEACLKVMEELQARLVIPPHLRDAIKLLGDMEPGVTDTIPLPPRKNK
jgi:hypothetical protein